MKYYQTHPKSQLKLPNLGNSSGFLLKARSHSWKHLPFFFIGRLSKGKRSFLNTLLWCQRNWHHTQASDRYFARRVGVTRETICRYRQEFEALGFISQVHEHMQVCKITLSDFFNDGPIKRLLKPLLPAIACFSLSLLSVQHRPEYIPIKNAQFAPKKNITPYNTLSFFSSFNTTVSTAIVNSISFFKKKVELMEATRRYGGLHFTEYGLIRLSAYPYPALHHAVQRWKLVSDRSQIDDPFKWFCWMAERYCRAHKLKPEWALMHKRLEGKGYTEDSLTHRFRKDTDMETKSAIKRAKKGNDTPPLSPYSESSEQKAKWDATLARAQARIRERNAQYERKKNENL